MRQLSSSTDADATEPGIGKLLMILLIVLIATTLLARLAGQFGAPTLRDWAAATRVGLAVMFCFTGTTHFNSMRNDMIRMVPPMMPNPAFLVTLTGVCEIAGAIGLLVPRTRRVAAVALILLLLAVLPANVYAAMSGVTFRGAPPEPLMPRILLQLLLIAVVWWSGVRATSVRSQ